MNCRIRALLLAVLIACARGSDPIAIGEERPPGVPSLPFSLPAYIQEIDRWGGALEKLKDHPESAARLHRELPAIWRVTAGGESIEAPTGWLGAGLDEVEKDPKTTAQAVGQMLARLRAMRREAQDLVEASPPIDGSARENLSEILARREFRGVHGPSWLEPIVSRILEWLSDWINGLGARFTRHRNIVTFIFWLFLISAAGGLLVWMVRRLLQRSGTPYLHLPGPQADGAVSWQHMAQNARQVAARNEYREAIRLAYWAAVVRLEEMGLWSVDRARTHREYLRLVRPDQPQREPLDVLTRKFESAWYAARPPSEDNFRTVLTQLEKLGCA